MYSTELIEIIRALPYLTDDTFSAIDNFLGEVGEGNIFKSSDLSRVIPQSNAVQDIIDFLLKKEIITPHKLRCNKCGRENVYPSDTCDYCSNKLELAASIYYFKVIGKINISDEQKRLLDQRKELLNISAFRILRKKIDKKIRNNEEAFIFFLDIANSTELSKNDPTFSSYIKTNQREYCRDLIKKYFLQSKAIYIKSDGDSSFAFFENEEALKSFIVEFKCHLFNQDFYRKIAVHNKASELKIYFKIYVASSKILEYHPTDMLSLDFSSAEAFVFINRIEKNAKKAIIAMYGEEKVFPFYIVSRRPLFSERTINLKDIDSYGEVAAYVSFEEDINNDAT